MAFEEDHDRRDFRYRSEEAAAADVGQHGYRSKERYDRYGHRNRNPTQAAANRWYTAARSFGEVRRSEDDPANVHPLRARFGKEIFGEAF